MVEDCRRTIAVGKVGTPCAVEIAADGLANGCGRVEVVVSDDELIAVLARVRHHCAVLAALVFDELHMLQQRRYRLTRHVCTSALHRI